MADLPSRAQYVIVGGGVIGASVAYHLAERGARDVVLIERTSLTHGSTWHAAGLVGQLRTSSNLTRLMRASVEEYGRLESLTGYATGWHGVGSLRLASSPQRWEELQRVVTMGKGFGFDVQLVDASEAQRLFPLIDTDGVYGATWVPTDGYVDPNQLTHAYATGARAAGVSIVQGVAVTGFERAGRRIMAVVTDQGRVECDTVVNATGMWGARTARLADVHVAVGTVEHQYVVTEKSTQILDGLPTLRDPDARFYLKPEAGSLVIGGWELGTRSPWIDVPDDFDADLFPADQERFEPLADGAINRIPLFGELGIHTWINGPIPFSPDAEPIMGITEDLDNMFHCCGFSAGIAAAGGAGQAMAGWILDADPGMDLWHFDVRRFGAPHNVPANMQARSVSAYEHYYDVAFPNRDADGPRGQRRSPLHDAVAAKGAVFGSRFGWERPDYFDAACQGARDEPSFARTRAWDLIGAEHRAVRERVGVADFTSFTKFEISGPGALRLLQRVAGANMDVPVGRIVYTQLLNERGGIEADVTITRLAEQLFYFVTGSAFGRHDVTFLYQYAPTDDSVTIRDVTSAYAVLNLAGPAAREVAQSISTSDLSPDAFRYMRAKTVDIGHAPVRALRATYVGELGYELHVPTEYARDLYERLMLAGQAHGITDFGYRATNHLRLEKQYVAWAADVRSDDSPLEAGLGFAVDLDKEELIAGPALRRQRDAGPTRRLTWFASDAGVVMHGTELIAASDGTLASVRSAGWGFTVQRWLISAYIPVQASTTGSFDVEVAGRRYPAQRLDSPSYDPTGARVRS